ncbi:MAG TPA: class I SAM-dependent methyltransferase [Microbacterium sp.]|nr:class I SAM-dependent methyltransferase [Microbacterium sp.]
MPDPMHFEAQASNYQQSRPPYPPELWATLRERGLLHPGTRALDIGAGTGQATGPMLAAGLHVTAVEPGARLAALLAEAFPAAEVIVGRAEDLELRAASFDLVVAATSIHWMDLDILLPKIARLLKPTGRLLVWRNVFGDTAVATPFRERIEEIVRDRESPARPGPDAEDATATAAQLTAGGRFEVEHSSTYRWSVDLDASQVCALFSTFSDWSTEEVERAADAVRDLGGRVSEHYTSWLIVLKAVTEGEVEPDDGEASLPRRAAPSA